jgi:hypothetical protein
VIINPNESPPNRRDQQTRQRRHQHRFGGQLILGVNSPLLGVNSPHLTDWRTDG